MNKKEIEQLVKYCWNKTKLLQSKEFVHFMHYFPLGIGADVKQYFNDVATKRHSFFMVPNRADRQKAVCSRCGKHIILAPGLLHLEKWTCSECGAMGKVVHGWRNKGIKEKYYFTYFQRALYDKEAIIARSFAVFRHVNASTYEVEDEFVEDEYYLMRKGELAHWTKDFGSWEKRAGMFSRNYSMSIASYIICNGWDLLLKLVPDSWLKYSQLEEYIRQETFEGILVRTSNCADIFKYIELYYKHPQVEYIMKMGLTGIVAQGVTQGSFQRLFNWRAKSIKEIFGVKLSKAERACVKRFAYNIEELKLALYVKENSSYTLTELIRCYREFEHMALEYKPTDELQKLQQYGVSVVEAMHYIFRQKKMHLKDWNDYLEDCVQLGMNLQDTAVLKPHNLQQAHQNIVKQLQLKADAILNAKIKQLKEQRKQYKFSAGEIFCRPAASTDELIAEGKALSHCVGTYAKKHAAAECTIILIRRKGRPDVPFYTMELSPHSKIVQVRGDHNCGMTDDVKAFVEAFKRYLAGLKKKKEAKAA